MPRQPRQPSRTGIHHIMLRGINRQRVFEDDRDYAYFLDSLRRALTADTASLYAYCLMPNHVHPLIEEGREPVSVTIKRVATRYAGWFNRKYGRVGHFFQDRFASRAVEDDAYFLAVVQYIHANPVRAALAERATDYRWSSRATLTVPNPLVDVKRLERYLPLRSLWQAENQPSGPVAAPAAILASHDSPPRLTDRDVGALLRQASGTATISELLTGSPAHLQATMSAVRSQGATLRQLARVTGLGVTTVHRLAGGNLPGPAYDATAVRLIPSSV